MFKDFNNNQSFVVLLKSGLPKKQLLLNEENNQEVTLALDNGEWVVNEHKESSGTNILLCTIPLLLILLLALVNYKTQFLRLVVQKA